MELASQMCRQLPQPGAGVGGMGPDDENDDAMYEAEVFEQRHKDDAMHLDMIGMIEEKQPLEVREDIIKRLNNKLEELEYPVEEIWLDALLSLLEEMKALQMLQKFF